MGTFAGVQPQQDPGEPSGLMASAKERHVGPALIGPSLLGGERERKKERDQTRNVQQSLAVALFFTIAFIP